MASPLFDALMVADWAVREPAKEALFELSTVKPVTQLPVDLFSNWKLPPSLASNLQWSLLSDPWSEIFKFLEINITILKNLSRKIFKILQIFLFFILSKA